MTSFHKSVSTAKKDQEEKKNTAVSKLEQFLLERRGARQPVDDLQEFERELHSLFAAAEAEVVGHEVERFDIDLPFVTVDGIVGDVLRSLSKKEMYGSPNSNPSPELGADKENHTSWERYYQVSDCSSSLRNDWYSGI